MVSSGIANTGLRSVQPSDTPDWTSCVQECAQRLRDEVHAWAPVHGTAPHRDALFGRGAPDDALNDDGLSDEFLGSQLQAMHAQCEKARPNAASLAETFPDNWRRPLAAWVMTALHSVNCCDESVLFSTLTTLDRFYEKTGSFDQAELLLVTLAALSLSVKMQGQPSALANPRMLLQHLAQGHVTAKQIVDKEMHVLQTLGFLVSVPAPVEILGLFIVSLRERGCAFSADLVHQAKVILRIALMSSATYYGYPHAVLAASTAYLLSGQICEAPDNWQGSKVCLPATPSTSPPAPVRQTEPTHQRNEHLEPKVQVKFGSLTAQREDDGMNVDEENNMAKKDVIPAWCNTDQGEEAIKLAGHVGSNSSWPPRVRDGAPTWMSRKCTPYLKQGDEWLLVCDSDAVRTAIDDPLISIDVTSAVYLALAGDRKP